LATLKLMLSLSALAFAAVIAWRSVQLAAQVLPAVSALLVTVKVAAAQGAAMASANSSFHVNLSMTRSPDLGTAAWPIDAKLAGWATVALCAVVHTLVPVVRVASLAATQFQCDQEDLPLVASNLLRTLLRARDGRLNEAQTPKNGGPSPARTLRNSVRTLRHSRMPGISRLCDLAIGH
jgi:hypothetical protein